MKRSFVLIWKKVLGWRSAILFSVESWGACSVMEHCWVLWIQLICCCLLVLLQIIKFSRHFCFYINYWLFCLEIEPKLMNNWTGVCVTKLIYSVNGNAFVSPLITGWMNGFAANSLTILNVNTNYLWLDSLDFQSLLELLDTGRGLILWIIMGLKSRRLE